MNLLRVMNFCLCLCCLLQIGCSSKKNESEKEISSQVQSFFCEDLKTLTSNKKKFFNVDSIGSYKSFEKVKENFYKEYLENSFQIPFEKSKLYYFSYLEGVECNLILLQETSQTPNALYLIIFSSEGKILSTELLAKKTSYPGSETLIKSRVLNNKILQRIRIEGYVGDYIEKEDRYSEVIDSIYQKLVIYDSGLIKVVDKDSVRIEK
jgi:hypothetical protein